jgi:hypothetical protein
MATTTETWLPVGAIVTNMAFSLLGNHEAIMVYMHGTNTP